MRQCRNNCGTEISDSLQFCSKDCAAQYKEKREAKFSEACPESAKILEEEKNMEKEAKNCQNCGKPVESGLFCSIICDQMYHKNPVGAKPLALNEIDEKFNIVRSETDNEKNCEIRELMSLLGRGSTDGNVHGSHLGKVLSVCQNPPKQVKTYRDLCSYLSLICGMQQRYVKESYLQGLEVCGVITIFDINNDKFFKWIGKKAFENDGAK